MTAARTGISRRQAIGALLCAGGATLGATLLGDGADLAESRPSAAGDAQILSFALTLESVQAAFYAEAVARDRLSGELALFARVVAGHEREHVQEIRRALGPDAARPPRFAFGDAVTDPVSFRLAARNLEDLGVTAYNSYAPGLTKRALAPALRIVAVEARHAAWIRDIAGMLPAPAPAEPRASGAQVTAALKRTGFVR
jgi:hypothetical protein